MVLPSWCSSENPFLMPRPPSQLANSSTDLNSYIQQYACDDPTDPFAECSLIESFFAYEVFQSWDCDTLTASGNCSATTFKGVTASVRDTSDFDTTSHISIFDSRFNLLSTPVHNYSGSLSFVELQPATYNGGLTTWAVYGGPSGANFSAPIPPDGYFPACGAGGCVALLFIEMDASKPGGLANLTSFTSAGQFFEQPAVMTDVKIFSGPVGGITAAKLNALAELVEAARAADTADAAAAAAAAAARQLKPGSGEQPTQSMSRLDRMRRAVRRGYTAGGQRIVLEAALEQELRDIAASASAAAAGDDAASQSSAASVPSWRDFAPIAMSPGTRCPHHQQRQRVSSATPTPLLTSSSSSSSSPRLSATDVLDYVAITIHNSDPSSPHFGWTVGSAVLLPASSPVCSLYQPDAPAGYPCVVATGRWPVRSNGQQVPPDVNFRLRTATARYNCSLRDGMPPTVAAYEPFYTGDNCDGATPLLFLSSDTTISTFAFALVGNSTDPIDITLSPAARTFDAEAVVGAGSVVSDFSPFAEVVLSRPRNANISAADDVQPTSVWLSVATFTASQPGVEGSAGTHGDDKSTPADEMDATDVLGTTEGGHRVAGFLSPQARRSRDALARAGIGRFGRAARSSKLQRRSLRALVEAASPGEASGFRVGASSRTSLSVPPPGTGALILMRLPQFSDPVPAAPGGPLQLPPLQQPSLVNPAGTPEQGWNCGWVEYWNGTGCAPQPSLNMVGQQYQYATQVQARWRALPGPLITTLSESGCMLWDTTCIANWANATFGNASDPFPALPDATLGVSSSSEPAPVVNLAAVAGPRAGAFRSPHAAARFARMSAGERREMRSLWGSLAEAVHASNSNGAAPKPLLSSSAAPSVQEIVSAAYGNRFLIFAASSLPTLGVFDAVPVGCLPSDGMRVVSSLQSVLPVMGPLRSLQVTQNGQYVMGILARPAFVLHAMERTVAVCAALAANPSDAFLQGYASACKPSDPSMTPRLPSVPDFLSVASACAPGALCPSFNSEIVEAAPGGVYTTFGFDVTDCPAGSFCVNGQKQASPMGFTAPVPGLTYPAVCDWSDATYMYTCAATGLVERMQAPDGTLGGVPILPPVPAPPGYAQLDYYDSGINMTVRTLVSCPAGEWCGLGRSASEGQALLVPAGTFANSSSVLEPTVCNLNGSCTSASCAVIPFCPAGSAAQALCPPGHYCPNTTAALNCSDSTWCAAGSVLWELCPAGYYCPDPATRIPCPNQYYCTPGSTQPVECSWLSHCFCSDPSDSNSAGCAEPPANQVLAITALFMLACVGLYLLWRFWLGKVVRARIAQWKQERLQRARRRMRSLRLRASGSSGSSFVGSGSSGRPSLGLPLLTRPGSGSGAPIASPGSDSGSARPLLLGNGDKDASTATLDAEAGYASLASGADEGTGAPSKSRVRFSMPASASAAAAGASTRASLNALASDADDDGGSLAGHSTDGTATGLHTSSSFGSSIALTEEAKAALAMRPLSVRPMSTALPRKTFPVHVRLEGLGLRLKSDKTRMVLNGVNAELRPGRIVAVMGPSGAGKTTCLTTLAGKATYGELTGRVFINGAPGLLTDTAYRHLLGFVPQDDVMHRDLTVEENVTHAAMTRLPASWSADKKLAFADYVLELLGLSEIRESPIGDETTRGISGGQRKRVNIALELAADPQVLLLDEPTSGLDAAGCTAVCGALQRIASTGVTVALVLHQPRYELFSEFHDLLLLGKGGRTVYTGPTPGALPYFEHLLGLTCPPRVNPADWLMDVIAGDMPAAWKAAHPEWKPSDLFAAWERHTAGTGGGPGSDGAAAAGPGATAAALAAGVPDWAPASASASLTCIADASNTASASLAAGARPSLASAHAGTSPALTTAGVFGAGAGAGAGAGTGKRSISGSGSVGFGARDGIMSLDFSPHGSGSGSSAGDGRMHHVTAPAPPPHDPVGFWRLTWLIFMRSVTQQMRHPLSIAINNALPAVTALFLAALYWGTVSYSAPQPIEAFTGCPAQVASGCQVCLAAAGDNILNRGVMTVIGLSLTGVATFLTVFLPQRIVYWREASTGSRWFSLAYFVGNDLAWLFQLLLGPLVFTVAYEALTTPRMSFAHYYVAFLGVYFCASGIGHITAIAAPPSLAQLVGVVATFSFAMFSGGQPTLREMQGKWIPLRWAPSISFLRYALEALYVGEVQEYAAAVQTQGVDLAQLVDSNFGYDINAYSKDIAIVFAYGVALRLVAIAVLHVMHSNKKK